MVKRTVESGKTILVEGPASVEILSGKVNILGAAAKRGERLIIREGKRAPFEVDKRASFDLTLGNGASSEEIEGSTIPPSWKAALTDIFSRGKPVTVMVIGDIDSGKTSFCTFLANEAVRTKRRTAIIDADLGQSDIGPPSTIGFSLIKSSVKDLFEIEAERAYFVGVTSPTGAAKRVLEGLTTLKAQASDLDIDFLIINTDGWIEGEQATEYKASLVEHVRPDVVVGTQHGEELAPILDALDKAKTLTVRASPAVHKRSREKRKILRELAYAKYLKNAKVESFPLDWIKVEGGFFGVGRALTREQMRLVRDAVGRYAPIYSEETLTRVLVVLRKGQWVDEEEVKKAEEKLGKQLKVILEGEEDGLLVALNNERGEFLGIGVLCGIDYKRRVLKVYTPVTEDVASLRFGQMKLDKNGREIGLSTILTGYNW